LPLTAKAEADGRASAAARPITAIVLNIGFNPAGVIRSLPSVRPKPRQEKPARANERLGGGSEDMRLESNGGAASLFPGSPDAPVRTLDLLLADRRDHPRRANRRSPGSNELSARLSGQRIIAIGNPARMYATDRQRFEGIPLG
jgi:hypothetical protein